jgi:Fe-S cluster assembly iron-binding protein IscA
MEVFVVLRITPGAGLAIRRLVDGQGGGGLRLDARAGDEGFTMSVAPVPEDADLVVTEESTGARVLMDSRTAEYTDDKTLDVDDTVEGTLRFQLGGQGVTDS